MQTTVEANLQSALKATPQPWSPSSWRQYPILQQPEFESADALHLALAKVHALPPLVHYKEVDRLKATLADACNGKVFLLQGGDCAERFIDCTKVAIENKFKILLQMSLIIIWCAHIPVVRVARMAGQFAKPRTSTYEKLADGSQVYSFKGDNINGFDVSERVPDPNRLVQAYFHSAATLNYLRGMIAGGVADLHSARDWNLENVVSQQARKDYTEVIDSLQTGLEFMNAIHVSSPEVFRNVDLYTSHEGLVLAYEEALTEDIKGEFYNLGAHFLWIGDRTRQLNGAHVEYFKGIANPIGIKVGPSMKTEELVQLVQVLNPKHEPGRLTIITRYGAAQVRQMLPAHIQAVKTTGIPVVWCCDPCHGNGRVTESGVKTRRFEDIVEEIVATFEVHRANGSTLGGLHLELTGEDVTECVGGSAELDESHLSRKYETFCDPRLNYTQSLDVAFTLSKLLGKKKTTTY